MSSSHHKSAYCESTLFNYETTYRTDFRENKILPLCKTPCQERRKGQKKQYTNVKYLGTMLNWKGSIPFNALWKPKEIVRTNPLTPQEPYEKIEDLDREKVQKTRPRLVMTPAVSIDEMDPVGRAHLIEDTYTSETSRRTREACAPFVRVKAPFPDTPMKANPLKLPRLTKPYVSEEWRMESVLWDRKQVRSSIDATKHFWLQPEHAPSSCKVCEETAIIQQNRKNRFIL